VAPTLAATAIASSQTSPATAGLPVGEPAAVLGVTGQPPWTPAYENISHSPPTIAAAATRAHPARASHHDGGRLNCLTRAIRGGRTGGCSR